ncbi:MAG: threonine aldolase [Bacilli bacterium]|nr:threonine aldolase [Bacilli bacterium]
MKHKFTNDYSSLCHPSILKFLASLNEEQNVAYGLDKHSLNAERYIKDIFESPRGQVYFIAGGTMTNLLFISYALRPYEAVISLETGHINVHETGAIEATGHKIITVKGSNGKMSPSDILNVLKIYKDEHMVKPKLVYISDSTEIGTIYTRKELIALNEVCREHDLYLFIDGARLGSALTSKENDVEPGLFGQICDAFYVGGAKNGLLLGEALVINNPELQKDFRYHIKNKGAMISKGYLLGAIFEEAFRNGLYFDIAKDTNETADYLKEQLANLEVNMLPSPTNQIFAIFNKEQAKKLINEYGLELWEERDNVVVVRFVVSFTTKKADVDELISFMKTNL